MVVTQRDKLPLFHLTYEGNLHDSKVFQRVIDALKKRLQGLDMEVGKHTIVFDRGNNSRQNMVLLQQAGLHYVGALIPYQHQGLMKEAMNNLHDLTLNENTTIQVYRDAYEIWGEKRTVVIYISEHLKTGQIRGLYRSLEKTEKSLQQLQTKLLHPEARKRDREKLTDQIKKIISVQYIKTIIDWSLTEISPGKFQLHYHIKQDILNELEGRMGFRILMTDHHDWTTAQIVHAYHGQSQIEQAFKELKNPHHLAIKPQFHWTNQKIHVHYFICVLGYLLTMLIYKQAKEQCHFSGCINSLLETLNQIRLGTLIEASKTTGKAKAIYKIEEMDKDEQSLIQALEVEDIHLQRPKLQGVGVYN